MNKMLEYMQWVEQAANAVREKLAWVSERSADKIPYTAINGVHDDKSDPAGGFGPDDGINWWCNGFWPGMMWQMYAETGEQRYAQIARRAEQKLDRCFEEYYGLHHDVGFMWLPSAVADYRLTGDADARRRGLHAANLLAGRFNPVGNYLRAWNDAKTPADTAGWVIIDSMLNIPLLYWAWEETKDPRFRHKAIAHANTVKENFVRPDGSVRHIVEFDPETGAYRTDLGGQGYGQGSSWSRGQAWGMYGFFMSYHHTGNPTYLDTAKRIAHYFIANIPEDGIIPVDFRQPEAPSWCDDTAAADAACALIEISRVVDEYEQRMYLLPALKLLQVLVEQHSDFTHDSDCILQKATAAYHDEAHEFPIIYGDYYLCEALFKLKGKNTFLW